MADDKKAEAQKRTAEGDPDWRPSKLSYSMASTYQQCPRKWKAQYILGIRVGTPLPALLGSFVHEVLEDLYEEEPTNRTLDTAREIATSKWPELQEDEDFIKHDLSPEEALAFKHGAWKNVHGLFQMEDPQRVDVIATEQKLVVEIDGVPYGGYVDRLDDDGSGGVIVRDYKTGKPGLKKYQGKKLKQVQLYAAMVREELGYTPTRVSLVFPSHQETIEAEATDKSMQKVTTELGGVWKAIHKSIENDDFPPSVGPLCAWCDFVGECPEGTQETINRWEMGRVREDAPGVEILGLKSGDLS
jgi:putative RecB family exonuclease